MIRSPLVTAVDEAMEFIKKSIRLEYQFTGELRRINRWEYPLPALREILLNAIIHKDYRDPTDLIIKIFDDRIEVTNPGKLIGGLTVDDLKTDYYHAKHRNKLLAEAFYLMGEIEKYGTGFIRLRQQLQDYPELAYDIIEKGDFMRVILKNISEGSDKVPDRVPDKVADQLTANQRKILELIQQNSKISMAQMAEEIGISKRKILENINKLKSKNLLERVGSTKTGYWKII